MHTFKLRGRSSRLSHTMEPAIRLWLLRILVPLGAHRELIGAQGFTNDAVAEVLGLGRWIDPDQNDFDPKAIFSTEKFYLIEIERLLWPELIIIGSPVCGFIPS